MSNILITGISGLLGNNLAFAYRNKHKVFGIYNAHSIVIKNVDTAGGDLLDQGCLSKMAGKFRPDIIIHSAALSEVDKCEEDKGLAYKLNVEMTQNIVRYAENVKAHLIYISTDCIYDGIKGNFKEEDVNPINYYGETKLLGEKEALKYQNTFVARTNFFGINIRKKLSLAEWVLESLKKNTRINGFCDVFFSAMYVFLLSDIIEKVFSKRIKGIYNVGSSDHMSKYDFSVSLAEQFGLDRSLINKTSIDDTVFSAKRGKNMSLDTGKIEKSLGMRMPLMKDSIARFHDDYAKEVVLRCSE